MIDTNMLKEIVDEIFRNSSMITIEKKLKNKEELTAEEKDIYLKYLLEKAKSSIQESKAELNKLNKKTRFVLKLVSITGKILGGTQKTYTTAMDNSLSALKNHKKNNKELIKGIIITSNNMTTENFLILNEQANETEAYHDAFLSYAEKFIDCSNSYECDFSELGNEELKLMKDSKAKVKQLSKKYEKTNSK